MNIPKFLSRLHLPLWTHICPKCRKEVKVNSHECPHCGEKYPLTLKVPFSGLKDPKKLEAYVHQHIFLRISEFERNYLTQYFTTFFSDGFESGSFSAWSSTDVGTGDSATVQSSIVNSGIYAAKFVNNTQYSLVDAIYYGLSQLTLHRRAYVNVTAIPGINSWETNNFFLFLNSSWATIASLAIQNQGSSYVLHFSNSGGGASYDSSNVTFNVNTWYQQAPQQYG
jgi:hypothetical protein